MVRKVSIWVMLVGILWLPASALGVPSEPTRTPCEFVAQVLVEIDKESQKVEAEFLTATDPRKVVLGMHRISCGQLKKSSLAWIDANCPSEKSVG